MIHGSNNLSSTIGTVSFATEHRSHDSHQQGCRYTLAAHIANAEEQAVVAHEIVVEVASHIASWCQRGIKADIGMLR